MLVPPVRHATFAALMLTPLIVNGRRSRPACRPIRTAAAELLPVLAGCSVALSVPSTSGERLATVNVVV